MKEYYVNVIGGNTNENKMANSPVEATTRNAVMFATTIRQVVQPSKVDVTYIGTEEWQDKDVTIEPKDAIRFQRHIKGVIPMV